MGLDRFIMSKISGNECDTYFLGGTLITVDQETETAEVMVQDKSETYENVNIHYHCDSAGTQHSSSPFQSGDRVVVMFDVDELAPIAIIGFEGEPKTCGQIVIELQDGTKEIFDIYSEVFSAFSGSVVSGNKCLTGNWGNLEDNIISGGCSNEDATVNLVERDCSSVDNGCNCEKDCSHPGAITWYSCGVPSGPGAPNEYSNNRLFDENGVCDDSRRLSGVGGMTVEDIFQLNRYSAETGNRKQYWGFCYGYSCETAPSIKTNFGMTNCLCEGNTLFPNWGEGVINQVLDYDYTTMYTNMDEDVRECLGIPCRLPFISYNGGGADLWTIELPDQVAPSLINYTSEWTDSENFFVLLTYMSVRHADIDDTWTFNCIWGICEDCETKSLTDSCNHVTTRNFNWTDKIALCINGDCEYFAIEGNSTSVEEDRFAPAISDYQLLINEYNRPLGVYCSVFKAGGDYYCHIGKTEEGQINVARVPAFESRYASKNIIKVEFV